jgi:hypothetical protein
VNRRRFTLLLIAALAVLAGALYVSSERNRPPESQTALLLPELAHQLDTVTEVRARKGAGTAGAAAPGAPAQLVTLHQIGGRWTVAERADYPADVAKLRKLLLALADARIVEEKTANPANFALIGLDDPAQPGAAGTELTLIDKAGTQAVIIGKPVGEGSFARRGGETQSYIVAPALSIESWPGAWIDSRLIDVPLASLQSIEIKPADGPGYSVHRLKPHEESFALEGIPAGRKAAESATLAPSPNLLSGLSAEDVAPAQDLDFNKANTAILTLSDGNIITITGASIGEKHWIEIKSSQDAALTAKAAGRAFEVAGFRYDAIFRPVEQLLVPKAARPAAAPPAKAGIKHPSSPTP